MQVDENEFFRQTTMRLCSSLEIETALWRCLQYFKTVMPVDEIYLDLFDSSICAIRRVACAEESGGSVSDLTIPLPERLRAMLLEQMNKDEVHLYNHVDSSPFSRDIAPFVKLAGMSDAVMPLRIEGEYVGGLILRAYGEGRYRPEHGQLLSLVREPFALAMTNALQHQEVLRLKDLLVDDNRYLNQQLLKRSGSEIVGAGGGLTRVMEQVRLVAPLNNTVLLLGETGVGKEVIANAIHQDSPRKEGPLIKVNCGAIPESLIDSELFGHEKGAFSGAVALKRGRFERANGGTLFLDEIGELPLSAQTRLLRVLQNHEIERVGGSETIAVDLRIIAATHRDLGQMVKEQLFREDLWFRLNGFPITIPPLRCRQEDIPELVHCLVAKKSLELGCRQPPEIADGAIEQLLAYDWPGNVRELENVIERALIQNKGRQLNFAKVSRDLDARGAAAEGEHQDCLFPCLPRLLGKAEQGAAADSPLQTLDEVSTHHIRRVLQHTWGKVKGGGGAAEILGVNSSTLRNRMKKLGIDYGRNGA